jgi:hypothetical protein
MVDRTAHGGLISSLHRSHHQYASHLGLFEKRKQQLLLLLDRQVLATTSALGLTRESRLPLAQVVGLDVPHRARLPAQRGGNLRGAERQSGAHPDTLDALIFSFTSRLLEQHC